MPTRVDDPKGGARQRKPSPSDNEGMRADTLSFSATWSGRTSIPEQSERLRVRAYGDAGALASRGLSGQLDAVVPQASGKRRVGLRNERISEPHALSEKLAMGGDLYVGAEVDLSASDRALVDRKGVDIMAGSIKIAHLDVATGRTTYSRFEDDNLVEGSALFIG